MRTFETGATRDSDSDKFDYEGFLSPLFLEGFAAYMHMHRHQTDGSLRASDNWQKGIPIEQYVKSLLRHVFDLWRSHRQGVVDYEAAYGVMFNIQGYVHENLKRDDAAKDNVTNIEVTQVRVADTNASS